jgi:hypothetical protein
MKSARFTTLGVSIIVAKEGWRQGTITNGGPKGLVSSNATLDCRGNHQGDPQASFVRVIYPFARNMHSMIVALPAPAEVGQTIFVNVESCEAALPSTSR